MCCTVVRAEPAGTLSTLNTLAAAGSLGSAAVHDGPAITVDKNRGYFGFAELPLQKPG